MEIIQKVRNASLESFEEVGHGKFYAALEDANNISTFPVLFIGIINSAIILLCGLWLMITESYLNAFVVVMAIVALISVYAIRNTLIEKELNKVRDLENIFFQYLNDLLRGFRELKMSSVRKRKLVDERIGENRILSRDGRYRTALKYIANDLSGTYTWYVIIGILLFGISRISEAGVPGGVSSTFTLLFIMSPITYIVRCIPTLTTTKIAYARLNQLRQTLSVFSDETTEEGQHADEFKSIGFHQVTYRYNAESEFQLGPIDLQINKGEIIFITGSNGSGKTTFSNLLAGIYKAHEGSISFNGSVVDPASPTYRDKMSALFTDPHLFAHNYENYRFAEVKDHLDRFALLLKMESVISVNYEKDFITTDLSKGQKKRIGLILALLEDRPLILMDEWVAEQDPEFREYFYNKVIPVLRSMGKTMLLITHHDQYFDLADRVFHFDNGKVQIQ